MIRRASSHVNRDSLSPHAIDSRKSPTPADQQQRRERLIFASMDRICSQIDRASDGAVALRLPLQTMPQRLEVSLDISPIVVNLWQTSCIRQLTSGLRGFAQRLIEIAGRIDSGVADEWQDELRPHLFLAVSPAGDIITSDFRFSSVEQAGREWANENNQGPVRVVQCELSDFPEAESQFREWLENGRAVTQFFPTSVPANRGGL